MRVSEGQFLERRQWPSAIRHTVVIVHHDEPPRVNQGLREVPTLQMNVYNRTHGAHILHLNREFWRVRKPYLSLLHRWSVILALLALACMQIHYKRTFLTFYWRLHVTSHHLVFPPPAKLTCYVPDFWYYMLLLQKKKRSLKSREPW